MGLNRPATNFMATRPSGIVDGTLFKTVKSLAKAYGLHEVNVGEHIRAGLSWQEAVYKVIENRDRHKVTFAGREFKSKNELAAFYGFDRDKIKVYSVGERSLDAAIRAAIAGSLSRIHAPQTKVHHCGKCGSWGTAYVCKCRAHAPFTRVRQCACCGKWHEWMQQGKRLSLCSGCFDATANDRKVAARTKHNAAMKKRRAQKRRDGLLQSGHHFRRHKLHNTKIVNMRITARKVAEKYDHICQVCGRTVERHLGKDYQPLGWTIGHIKPLAHGGNTTWQNVQCECVQCNTWKANSRRTNPPWSILQQPISDAA